jgi:glutamate dehydrogenase
MLIKVSKLPREDRWDALARGALRDDLYSVLESLTRAVIEANGTDGSSDASAQYDTWAKANKESITRTKGALAAIIKLDNPNIAALSVALRTLRSVIRVGAASS